MVKSCKNYGVCLKPLLFTWAEVDGGAHFTFKLFLQDGALGQSFSYISKGVLEFKKKLLTGNVHKQNMPLQPAPSACISEELIKQRYKEWSTWISYLTKIFSLVNCL